MNAVTKYRDDEAAYVKKKKKRGINRKKPRETEYKDTGITPDES